MTDSRLSAPANGIHHMDALPPGTRLAEFEILSLLGVGGFGVVYKAFDHSLHRAVAIKEYMPSALAGRADGPSMRVRTSGDEVAFQVGLQSFVSEARLLAQFDHPSLVKVYRFWEAHNTAYMAMPLYSGMTFKQARAQMRTPPPEAWMRQILWAVLGALRTLHDGNTLHRDISPDNIFLQDVGPPVLLDLGAARHAINDQDHQHTAVLKVSYAPVEQYGDTGLEQGPWSDLYSLAAVVHGCLCNDTPLPSTLRSIRDRMVPFARVAKTVSRQFGQEYSPAFVAAIGQALALQPADRPQSIDAFLQTMEMVVAPPGLEHFDFRAGLDAIWVEPTDQPNTGQAAPVPTVDLTSAVAAQQAARAAALPHPKPSPAPEPVVVVPGVAAAARAEPEAPAVLTPALPAVAAAESMPPSLLQRPVADAVAQEGAGTEADTVFMDTRDASDMAGQDSRQPFQETVAHDALSGPGAMHHSTPPARKAPVRRAAWAAVFAGVAVIAIAIGVAGTQTGKNAVAALPQDSIITEMAEPGPPAPSGAVGAATDALAASEAMADGTSESAEPLPAFVPVSAQPAPARKTLRPATKPAVPTVPDEPAPAPPAPVAVVAPAPVVRSQPAPPSRPCADTNFFTESACLYRECAQPAYAGHAMCVEHRRRVQLQANKNMGN